MKNSDLISIIIPFLNQEMYLKRCVDSVLKQSYSNLQIILIDDGSTDKSIEISDDYAKTDSRVMVYHQENKGLSGARNKGIELSKGKYISFIDSDDFVAEDYVLHLYENLIQNNADISIIEAKAFYNEKYVEPKNDAISLMVLDSKKALKELLCSDFYFTISCGKLYKKELFQSISFPIGKIFEDVGTTYKLILESKNIVCSNEILYNYLIHKNSLTTRKFTKEKFDMIELTFEMTKKIVEKYPEFEKYAIRRNAYACISILSKMSKTASKIYQKEERELLNYLRNNKNILLKFEEVPKKDKLALRVILFNRNLFRVLWNLYNKMR